MFQPSRPNVYKLAGRRVLDDDDDDDAVMSSFTKSKVDDDDDKFRNRPDKDNDFLDFMLRKKPVPAKPAEKKTPFTTPPS